VEKIRMDIYDLGKTEVILGMLWLQAHNPEINWETGEVKMMRCSLLYSKTGQKKEKKKVKREKRVTILEKEKIIK